MIEKEEINDLMAICIENSKQLDEGVVFNKEALEAISKISEYARTTKIFKENSDRGKIFEEKTVTQIWDCLLDRIVTAPYQTFILSSILILMPFLQKAIQKNEVTK